MRAICTLTGELFQIFVTAFYLQFKQENAQPCDMVLINLCEETESNSTQLFVAASMQSFSNILEKKAEFKYELVNFLLPLCRRIIGTLFTIFRTTVK